MSGAQAPWPSMSVSTGPRAFRSPVRAALRFKPDGPSPRGSRTAGRPRPWPVRAAQNPKSVTGRTEGPPQPRPVRAAQKPKSVSRPNRGPAPALAGQGRAEAQVREPAEPRARPSPRRSGPVRSEPWPKSVGRLSLRPRSAALGTQAGSSGPDFDPDQGLGNQHATGTQILFPGPTGIQSTAFPKGYGIVYHIYISIYIIIYTKPKNFPRAPAARGGAGSGPPPDLDFGPPMMPRASGLDTSSPKAT